MVQKPHYITTVEGPGLHRDQQVARGSDPADHREMISCQRHPQHGRLAPWRVTPHDARQQVEPGLVYPDDNPAFGSALFLSSGQRSPYHTAIACSSRWVARMIGFCGVQPRWAKIRLTWAG